MENPALKIKKTKLEHTTLESSEKVTDEVFVLSLNRLPQGSPFKIRNYVTFDRKGKPEKEPRELIINDVEVFLTKETAEELAMYILRSLDPTLKTREEASSSTTL